MFELFRYLSSIYHEVKCSRFVNVCWYGAGMGQWQIVQRTELASYAVYFLIIMWRVPSICSPLWLEECNAHTSCRRLGSGGSYLGHLFLKGGPRS